MICVYPLAVAHSFWLLAVGFADKPPLSTSSL